MLVKPSERLWAALWTVEVLIALHTDEQIFHPEKRCSVYHVSKSDSALAQEHLHQHLL